MFEIVKDYWVQFTFVVGTLGTLLLFFESMLKAIKCSLRNDILDIYDRCKNERKITHYQLESIQYSAELYFKLKGNSFVQEVIQRVKEFELVD